jgi:hypothetical protein
MNLSAPVLGLVGAVAGVVTAVAGYQLVTADLPGAEASETGALAAVEQPAGPDSRKVSYERCKPPAKLQGGACVTHKWRTVVVDGPSTSSVAAPSAAASPSPSQSARTVGLGSDDRDEYDDDAYDDQGDDRDEYDDDDDGDDHGDDHEDDDDGDDHGDDHEDDDGDDD